MAETFERTVWMLLAGMGLIMFAATALAGCAMGSAGASGVDPSARRAGDFDTPTSGVNNDQDKNQFDTQFCPPDVAARGQCGQ